MEKLLFKIKKAEFDKVMAKKGYAYFVNGAYNLNIIGIRRSGTEVTNRFDDFIVVTYKDDKSIWHKEIFQATTDPGLSPIMNPANKKGCAILVPGQYRGAYKIGYHKGQYEALCQCKPLPVYRDGNKDNKYDFNPKTIDRGMFGINIHKSGTSSTIVNGWSAGCQVVSMSLNFNKLMELAHRQIKCGMGNTFTYTLLKEEDL